MKSILNILSKPQQSAADLRAALAELGDTANTDAIDAAEAARKVALVSGSDADVERAEQELARARRERDRRSAQREEVEARLAGAEAREAAEALTAERAAAEELAKASVKFLKRYPALAAEIVAGLEALLRAEQAVSAINLKLAEAGRADERLDPVEKRVVPMPDHMLRPSLVSTTTMASRPGYCVGWNN